MCVPRYAHQKSWEVFEMADEIMKELWAIKDKLSEEAGRDMKAFCKRLNEESLTRGFRVVNRSRSKRLLVAEESAEYNVRSKT